MFAPASLSPRSAPHPAPRDGRPVPRWAHTVAHLIPLTTLPSGLWRIAIACGLSLGMLDHGEPLRINGWESVYLVCLSLTIEALALLMFFLPPGNISTMEATDAGLAVAVACYAPLLLWGPLLGALTIAYYRRRCRD